MINQNEIEALRYLNKRQAAMIARRDCLIDDIYLDAKAAAKGTVLENVARKCLVHFKLRKNLK